MESLLIGEHGLTVDLDAQKHEIEARYAALCKSVDNAADSDTEDAALREAFAELAAMMIAYTHETGAKEALQKALSRESTRGQTTTRTSLAARALKLIAENNSN